MVYFHVIQCDRKLVLSNVYDTFLINQQNFSYIVISYVYIST